MTDNAVCQWRDLRQSGAVPEESSLNWWMGQQINHCAWEPRSEPVVCE